MSLYQTVTFALVTEYNFIINKDIIHPTVIKVIKYQTDFVLNTNLLLYNDEKLLFDFNKLINILSIYDHLLINSQVIVTSQKDLSVLKKINVLCTRGDRKKKKRTA